MDFGSQKMAVGRVSARSNKIYLILLFMVILLSQNGWQITSKNHTTDYRRLLSPSSLLITIIITVIITKKE